MSAGLSVVLLGVAGYKPKCRVHTTARVAPLPGPNETLMPKHDHPPDLVCGESCPYFVAVESGSPPDPRRSGTSRSAGKVARSEQPFPELKEPPNNVELSMMERIGADPMFRHQLDGMALALTNLLGQPVTDFKVKVGMMEFTWHV